MVCFQKLKRLWRVVNWPSSAVICCMNLIWCFSSLCDFIFSSVSFSQLVSMWEVFELYDSHVMNVSGITDLQQETVLGGQKCFLSDQVSSHYKQRDVQHWLIYLKPIKWMSALNALGLVMVMINVNEVFSLLCVFRVEDEGVCSRVVLRSIHAV